MKHIKNVIDSSDFTNFLCKNKMLTVRSIAKYRAITTIKRKLSLVIIEVSQKKNNCRNKSSYLNDKITLAC